MTPWAALLVACGPTPSFEADVRPLVERDCIDCHEPDRLEAGLDLWTDPYPALVEQPSTQSGLLLVEPGDSLYSYLFHKVNGSQALAAGAGTRMPLGATWNDADVAAVADWIDWGARP